MTKNTHTYSAADHLLDVFRRHAPYAAATVAPFVPRLFNALNEGHSFIWITHSERQHLQHAAPLVGNNGLSPLILQGRKLFLARYWQLEHNLAAEIQRLSTPITDDELPDTQQIIDNLKQWFPNEAGRDQQAAAALTLINRFTLISGGPGTGKTTTVAKLLALLCTNNRTPRIGLVAPTGKAAARMSEALKHAIQQITNLSTESTTFLSTLTGQTIHRLLHLHPPQMTPLYHSQHRLPMDILVADEASMLDNHLLLQLLSALPDACRVILLGDENQLPPIGAGAVLSALAEYRAEIPEHTLKRLHNLLPNGWNKGVLGAQRARLNISHRFGSNSPIGCLAHAIISGNSDAAWQQFQIFPESLLTKQGTPEQQANALYRAHKHYWHAIDNNNIENAFTHHTDISILAARRNDAEQFNQAYIKILMQRRGIRPDALWFIGQLIMITRNDPATNLFNGDVGIIMPHHGTPAAWFTDTHQQYRHVPLSRLPAHETAFAITVHKSQGSEYRQVWLLSPENGNEGFTRALLYTAVTRAKEQFTYWGTQDSFQDACLNHTPRRSALSDYL